jgi:hypothetical protein
MIARTLILLASAGFGQDIPVDEDALFADTSSLADSAAVAAAAPSAENGSRISLGGDILTVGQGSLSRDYFGSPDVAESRLSSMALADLSLDVRLQRDFKAFAALELAYAPSATGMAGDSGASWRLPELFLDAQIAHRAYFRVGKQVLQWGRTYFFNPTDLVNVERKSFFRRLGAREGVFGARVHVPFGTAWNLYGFLDTHGVGRPDSLAGAIRVERLLGRTEVSLLAWDGGGREPVYGADFSTRLLGLNLTGELAVHREAESVRFSGSGGIPAVNRHVEEWAPRASLGLGRSFRVSGVPDRLTAMTEYYYNGPGTGNRRLGLADFLAALPGGLAGAGAMDAAAASGLYQPNSYSRHYAAIFATLDRFLRRDLALTLNAIGNLDQSCAMLSGGIAYRDLNDFSLSLFVNGFAGPRDTEYTLAGEALQVQAIAEVAF